MNFFCVAMATMSILFLSGCSSLEMDDEYVIIDKNDDTVSSFSYGESGNKGTGSEEQGTDINTLAAITAVHDQEVSGNTLLIPDEVVSFMSAGISLSAFVRNIESGMISNQSFGEMTLAYHDKAIWLVKVERINDDFPLTDEAKSTIFGLSDAKFDQSGKLIVSNLLSMQVDIERMEVTVNIAPSLMAVNHSNDPEAILAASSVDNVTDLLSYSVYSNTMSNSTGTSRRDNIQFDNIASWQEHHLNTGGFISSDGDGDGDQRIELDELTYEYDNKGYRFDVGMKSGWSSIQSLGDVTTLNGQKVYGASLGNVAKSVKFDNRHALIPLIVYMPGNGEAKVFRDGRLLDIQHLNMGNQELDTSNFPVGVYDVDVEVSIGGRTMSKRTYQVNKPSGSATSYGAGLSWQVWGGAMEVEKLDSHSVVDGMSWEEYTSSTQMAPLAGVSFGSNWQAINWTATFYHNDVTQVSELHGDWQINSNYSLYAQTLAATDGALGMVVRGDATYFDGIMNMWLASERKSAGNQLNSIYDTSLDSAGMSLSLFELIDLSGALSLSYQQDHEYNSRYWSADYSHSFQFNDFGNWMLQIGTNKQYARNDYGDTKTDQFYASLSVSLPFDGNMTFGVSKNGDSDMYTLSGSANVDLGPITYVGTDISMSRGRNMDTATSYGAYFGYDTRYIDGSVSYSGSEGSSSISLSGRGAVALDNAGISAGSGLGEAAIVIEVPESVDDGGLIATVNQNPHELHDGRNLLIVPAYETYDINISNNLESEKSYQVDMKDNQFTLYPGNVVPVSVGVKEMITVFGRLKSAAGDGLANVSIKNHIGTTTTDSSGNFAIDVDSAFPEIIVEGIGEDKFKVEMKLVNRDGTALVGDIVLEGPPSDTYQIKPIG